MSMLKIPVTPNDHVQGNPHAFVTLVEYGDYGCSHCAAAQPVVKNLQQHFRDTLRLVYRHFPLTEIHPTAGPAAESVEFAGAHGLFWPMHDSIFANQRRLSLPFLFAIAGGLNLSQRALRSALETGAYTPKVKSDLMGGVRSGVNGTPTFFINNRRHDGPYGFADLVTAIEDGIAGSTIAL
jgi:protein-disulfide isomerase